jgi:hypothetical protein
LQLQQNFSRTLPDLIQIHLPLPLNNNEEKPAQTNGSEIIQQWNRANNTTTFFVLTNAGLSFIKINHLQIPIARIALNC